MRRRKHSVAQPGVWEVSSLWRHQSHLCNEPRVKTFTCRLRGASWSPVTFIGYEGDAQTPQRAHTQPAPLFRLFLTCMLFNKTAIVHTALREVW